MTTIPPEAIQAAAEAICGVECGEGAWATCEDALEHQDAAIDGLRAAEAVWPHTQPARSPESTVATVTERAPRVPWRPPPRPAHPFGFGKDATA